MPHVSGLRSPYVKVARLVYFGRMLDKIRLHAAGNLPNDYVSNLGDGQFYTLDGRCCRFLGVPYAAIRERVLAGGTDEEILAWTHKNGHSRTDEECHVWNRFILKLGWRDERSTVLAERISDPIFRGKTIETLIDHIEYDEGRDPVVNRSWENI
jgi:gluconokinase